MLAFYDFCPAPSLLVALGRHLGGLEAMGDWRGGPGFEVQDLAAAEAGRQLLRRFLGPGARGVTEILRAASGEEGRPARGPPPGDEEGGTPRLRAAECIWKRAVLLPGGYRVLGRSVFEPWGGAAARKK